jgi:signal transduction histidine kinase
MVVLSAVATLVAGLVGAWVVWLCRRRDAVTLVMVTALTAVLATAVGVTVAANQMFISGHDGAVLAAIVITAALIATACAMAVGRQVSRQIERNAQAVAVLDTERALELNRRDLVAWMSHDLRSPLAGIRAMAEALEDGVVDSPDSVALYHRNIRIESERLAGMVDDLFELSKLHSGALTLTLEQITLADIVAQAIPSMTAVAAAKDIRLTAEVPDVAVEVDVREMTRVLGNLLTNAIRHTPEGGDVRIGGGSCGTEAYLNVEDECSGIPPEDLEHVFDVAFRGTVARTPSGDGGAGLGLAIARGIAEAHGGGIDVENISDGCRFTVRLPVLSPAVPSASAQLPPSAPPPRRPAAASARR